MKIGKYKIYLSILLIAVGFLVFSNRTNAFVKGEFYLEAGFVFNKLDDAKLTLAKYKKIKPGMSYHEVVEIIGKEGVLQKISCYGKTETASYKWEEAGQKLLIVVFTGDKVNSKVQANLK